MRGKKYILKIHPSTPYSTPDSTQVHPTVVSLINHTEYVFADQPISILDVAINVINQLL